MSIPNVPKDPNGHAAFVNGEAKGGFVSGWMTIPSA